MIMSERAISRLRFRAALTIALRLWTALGITIVAPPAAAQTIELTKPLEPPALPKPSLAASMVEVLEKEAEALRTTAPAAEDNGTRAALTARANIRVLAAELLAAGDRAGAAGSQAIVQGLKLAVNRDAFDATIERHMPGGETMDAAMKRAAIEALNAFNRGVAEHVQRGGAGEKPGANAGVNSPDTEWLAPLLSRLIPAVSDTPGKGLQSHWIRPRSAPAAATAPSADEALADLRRRASAAATLDDTARGNLLEIIDFLDRGRQFPDLQPRVEEYRQTIDDLLDFSDAVVATNWLGDQQKAGLTAHLGEAIAWFHDSGRRQRGIEAAERLQAAARVLIAANALVLDNVEPKTMRAIIASVEAAADRTGTDREAARIHVQTVTVLERMAASRALGPSGLSRELRTIERDLAKAYRDTEAKVLKELAGGAIERGSLSDPGFASLLADHRERLEDLQRIRRMPQWSSAINRIYPPAAKDFDTQMRRRAQALLEPTKRPEARLLLERFEDELQMFNELPFELALREGTPVALQLTGGLNAQALALVVEKRRAWADEWSRADPAPDATKIMVQLHRLLQSMRDAAALVDLQPQFLNRWPAWQLSAEIVAAGQNDVITRLRLACAAAAGGDMQGLNDQLERMDRESPLAKLAGRLMHVLGSDLREQSDGADGALAQLVCAPPQDALLLKWREDFARLSRYAAEADVLRAEGKHGDEVREIQGYVNALATRLLAETAKQ